MSMSGGYECSRLAFECSYRIGFLNKSLLLAVFEGSNSHLSSKMLGEGTLIVKPVVPRNVGQFVGGGKQVITGSFYPSSGNELHGCNAKKFNKTTVKFTMIES